MIGLYYRENNERSLSALKKLKELLSGGGLKYRDVFDVSSATENSDDYSDIDLLIVFGGDGSVLKAAKIALDRFPVVAINTGNVGFLTSYEEHDLKKLVADIKEGNINYSQRRFMLVSCNGNRYYALNDAVIMKDHSVDNACECIKLYFSIDGERVDTYVADGLILSTPTGSTAYALSAGAPIVTPKVNAFVAAPICAHTLHSRPIVFNSESVSEITVAKGSKDCALYVDGTLAERVAASGKVVVERGDKSVRICDFAEKFFDKLSEKLTIWSMGETTGDKSGK